MVVGQCGRGTLLTRGRIRLRLRWLVLRVVSVVRGGRGRGEAKRGLTTGRIHVAPTWLHLLVEHGVRIHGDIAQMAYRFAEGVTLHHFASLFECECWPWKIVG